MSSFRKEPKTFKRLFIALAALSLIFSFNTCDLPMGLGDPIDWEPPVLTLEPLPPNPYYVGLGATLSGTVTDNIGVDRVILRRAGETEEIFRAALSGDRWVIELIFDESQNNEKIAVEVVAFDKMGNSGDTSIAAVTLIIDIRPPIIEDIWIQRTEIRKADLENYNDLKNLEVTDRLSERSSNVERYQNGFFYIAGKVAETETRIEIVSLNIYDTNDPDTALLELTEMESSSTYFSPRWLISEEALLAEGEALWPGYKDAYYNENARYYYRAVIIAKDLGRNESGPEGDKVVEEQGYFVMWQNADVPKGIIDPLMGALTPVIVTKGSTLPVEFFDDDQLLWAYADLLTIEQWNGSQPIASGVNLPANSSDNAKLEILRNMLRGGQAVYNWEFGKYGSLINSEGKSTEVIDKIAGQSLNEKIVYVQTSNNETDNGAYVLFTLTSDTKLAPHTNNGPRDTNRSRERYRVWDVNVIDENAPLIVFDTVEVGGSSYDQSVHPGGETLEPKGVAYRTGNSPEENTFPALAGGSKFTINGYTLRAITTPNDKVVHFRMAWIPTGIGTGDNSADSYIRRVQEALSDMDYPSKFNALPNMIQHWDFDVTDNAANPNTYPVSGPNGKLLTGTNQELDASSTYKKQVFQKTFDVLGGQDDLKSSYYNFRSGGASSTRENDIKLFIFYAEDNMGHIVFRQLRLLGNRTPPDLTVYDITGKDAVLTTSPYELPNLNNDIKTGNASTDHDYYFFNEDGNIAPEGRTRYEASLLRYQPQGYDALRDVAMSVNSLVLTDSDRTEPYTPYPRDTVVKYWVTAAKSGDLNVERIQMKDITYSSNQRLVGKFNDTDYALSYIEMLPEVTQRVFLFEAEDTLGNIASIQRTIAVTNAARLENITTTTQTGTYGIGTTITLQANFSNLVRWTGTDRPVLNVRYIQDDTPLIRQLPTKTDPETASLSLDFDFVVEQGFTGTLETMFQNMGTGIEGTEVNQRDRPITLPAGTQILDATRGDTAFTPGNAAGFVWTSTLGPSKSLQGSKTITLNGIRPVISNLTVNTGSKIRYTDANGGYYFKGDDTIEFTLTADKAIFTDGSPILEFLVGGNTTYRTAAWQRSSGPNAMVFSVIVNGANTPNDGMITGVRLQNVSTIVDRYGNAFAAGSSSYNTGMNTLTGNNAIRIDQTPPGAPETTLNNVNVTASNFDPYFNTSPTFLIGLNTHGETTGLPATGGTKYSLNGGVTWIDYPVGGIGVTIQNGQHNLVTRFIDRAGNLGAETSQTIYVNAKFPELKSITAVQTDGFYPRDGDTLTFTLAFEDRVWTDGDVTITLYDKTASPQNNTGAGGNITNSYQVTLTAANVTRENAATTLTFTWNPIQNKEMLNGLYVYSANFLNLKDRYGLTGGSGTTIIGDVDSPLNILNPASSVTSHSCTNLKGGGIKVDCIDPYINVRAPANGGVLPASTTPNNYNRNRTITLTFSEKMAKNSGIITIRPRGNYAIPAVFENNGYYLGTNGQRYSNPTAAPDGVYTTYVDGFYDIYNKAATGERARLTQGSDMSNLTLNARTGRSAGPYIRTTHGLVTGAGYTGDYGTAGANGPNPETGTGNNVRMIPDTSTKWVLDYRYLIDNTAAGAVTDIRTTLTNIKFRWQEIDVTSSNVTIANNVVTINLPEPLLDGLQWDLYYPAGTFTDESGRNAPAIARPDYWFWSTGVQAPVIRVNRRSFDARTANWDGGTGATKTRTYAVPANTAEWNTDGITITNDNGWGITDFNVVHYRIETETPGATLWRGVIRGTTDNHGAVNGAWTGTVQAANTGATSINNANWSDTGRTNGSWVLSNLIRRAGTGSAAGTNAVTYTVTENGVTITRLQTGNADYQGFRSYNYDPTKNELDTLNVTQVSAGQYRITFSDSTTDPSYEASKNYIVAEARRTGTTYTARSYEGIFRSVLMLNQASYAGNIGQPQNSMYLVEGSNIKNGMPSIAGFPVRDAEETGDNRFIKVFHYTANGNGGRFFWISTEIVSQWYQLTYGNTHQTTGEVNNYLSAGYGDLTYSYNGR